MRRILMRTVLGSLPPAAGNELCDRPARPALVVGGALMAASLIETPLVGIVLVGAGAALAARRGGVGRDDALGVAAGMGSAVATLGVFPRVEDLPARGIAVSEAGRVEPSPTGGGLAIVVNPGSGSGTSTDLLAILEECLPDAEIHVCEEGADLEDLLTDAVVGCRSLGVVGGDGSVNVAARVALDAGVPLVVFPGGTLNHFARDLGLDSVDDVVEAVRDGQVVAIDVATIADRTFVNNASIGSYSELVDERERLEGRLGKWPAMMVALVRILRRGQRFEVTLDGEPRCVWMIFFGNSGYEPAGFAPAERPDLVDGLLDVRILDAGRPFSRFRLVAAMLLGALARSAVYDRRLVSTISVGCVGDDVVRLAADGETFDGPPSFTVGKRAAALQVHMVDHDRTIH